MIATPLPGFREREQGVRRPALKHNLGLDLVEPASCIEHLSNRVTGIQGHRPTAPAIADTGRQSCIRRSSAGCGRGFRVAPVRATIFLPRNIWQRWPR
jgi:hypothetical protein